MRLTRTFWIYCVIFLGCTLGGVLLGQLLFTADNLRFAWAVLITLAILPLVIAWRMQRRPMTANTAEVILAMIVVFLLVQATRWIWP